MSLRPENIILFRGEDEDDFKRPQFNFAIEESIEEDDSFLVAPTPSVLLQEASDHEDEPDVTFNNIPSKQSRKDVVGEDAPLSPMLVQSDPALPAELEDDTENLTTFLSERGRRAISEEPTRMSRYSFGSIRMSDFGSELEIRRISNKQQGSAAFELQDDYAEAFDEHDRLGGETEALNVIQQPLVSHSPEPSPMTEEQTLEILPPADEDFQLGIPDETELNVGAEQETARPPILALAESMLCEEDVESPASVDRESEAIPSRRDTLLESMIATAEATATSGTRRRKLKMTQVGNEIPVIPRSLIKRIVHTSQEKANKRKTSLGQDHMRALEQATEWFFEQASQDLETYSSHAGRRTRIGLSDVLLLMRRQRILRNNGDLLRMAKDWLPPELLNELDIPDRP